jgi:hypothetical protein
VTALLAAGGHPAYRASSEAVMSLELNAIEYLQQVESDTPPPSATIEESAA